MDYSGYIDQFYGDENECHGNCGTCDNCDDSFYRACDEYCEEYENE